jgi:hypothetical protein
MGLSLWDITFLASSSMFVYGGITHDIENKLPVDQRNARTLIRSKEMTEVGWKLVKYHIGFAVACGIFGLAVIVSAPPGALYEYKRKRED